MQKHVLFYDDDNNYHYIYVTIYLYGKRLLCIKWLSKNVDFWQVNMSLKKDRQVNSIIIAIAIFLILLMAVNASAHFSLLVNFNGAIQLLDGKDKTLDIFANNPLEDISKSIIDNLKSKDRAPDEPEHVAAPSMNKESDKSNDGSNSNDKSDKSNDGSNSNDKSDKSNDDSNSNDKSDKSKDDSNSNDKSDKSKDDSNSNDKSDK